MLFYYAPASVNPYSLGIYERYYGLSGSFMFILFPFGICLITEFIYLFIKRPIFINIITISFLVMPAYLLILNYPRTDLHNNWIGDKFAKDILSSLPKNSILLVNNEDNVIFNSLYVQYAQNFRKDIKITSAHTLKSIPLLDAYLNQHKNNSIFTTSFTYAYWNWFPVAVVPQGLVLKFVMPNDKMILDGKDYYLNNQIDLLNKLSSGLPENKNISHLLYLIEIPGYYAMAYINTADYILHRYKDSENAKKLLLNAISIYQNLPEHYLMLASYYYESNDCRKTGKLLNKIETLPYIISTETIPYINKYGGFLVEAQKKCHGLVKNPFGPNGWSVY